MGYNLIELLKQFNQFKSILKNCNQTPQELLENEIKRRNINPQQLNDLIQEAQGLKQLFGMK